MLKQNVLILGAATATLASASIAAAATKVSGVIVPKIVKAPQGHAQILVGAKLATPAKLQVRITSGTRVVRTLTAPAEHPAGRAYVLVPAVDDKGFQLPAGEYVANIETVDADGKISAPVRAPVTLQLDPPLGRLDAFTVPVLSAFARQNRLSPGGQLVAVVAPGSAPAKAGLRRGDVIVAIGGKPTATPGAFRIATASTPASVPVQIDVRRGAQTLPLSVTLPADWSPAVDYSIPLTVANRRAPKSLFLEYAIIRNQVNLGRPDAAAKLLARWKPAARNGAVGQLLAGDIALARVDGFNALAAYRRSSALDPQSVPALVGVGLANTLTGDLGGTADALARAVTLDPSDSEAQATRALALLRLDRTADALAAATQALQVDPGSANAKIAQGIAQLAGGTKVDGLSILRQGIAETADPTRAAAVIAKNLEPNDP